MPDFSIKIVAAAGGGAAFIPDDEVEDYETGDLALGEEASVAGEGAAFVPDCQQVPQYSLITWNNTTDETHQPELTDKSFATDPILPGQSSRPDYYVTAAAPATISYGCKLHPEEYGTIVVFAVQNLPPEGEE
ncbi:MAG: hypothetical protein JF614_09000 [Acidobacteria bacterium]|nr:hypothetical protein [Acidobacteriota bacterium]